MYLVYLQKDIYLNIYINTSNQLINKPLIRKRCRIIYSLFPLPSPLSYKHINTPSTLQTFKISSLISYPILPYSSHPFSLVTTYKAPPFLPPSIHQSSINQSSPTPTPQKKITSMCSLLCKY